MKEPSKAPLDRIDVKILRALHAEGRLTNAELATRVGVSPATCHRRTQRLFAEGAITGVRAEVVPTMVGLGIMVIVGIALDGAEPASRAAFEEAVLKIKEVIDCHIVSGDFDFFLKIRCTDMEDFNRLQGEKLIALPGVRHLRTFFVMKSVKEKRPPAVLSALLPHTAQMARRCKAALHGLARHRRSISLKPWIATGAKCGYFLLCFNSMRVQIFIPQGAPKVIPTG